MGMAQYRDSNSGGRGRDERGFVLILALVMLAVLSILAAVLMNTSTTELKIVNNYQSKKQAFYAAERTVEYATNRNMLLTMAAGATIDLVTADAGVHKTRIDAGSTLVNGGGVLTQGSVQDLQASELPVKLVGWGGGFGANQYRVRAATEAGPAGNAQMRAQVRADTVLIRIYLKQEDSVFLTTGEG